MAEAMNYIDRLVAELCPDGVEYRPLGDVVEYAKKREKDGAGVQLYVGVENLKSDFLGCSPVSGSKGGIIFQKDDILLGNIRPYLKKMWISNTEGVSSPDVLVLRIQENEKENMVAKYLYYVLSSGKFVAYNISHSRGGKMPRGNKAKILEFELPIPPLEIQEAIVEILDKFTNLEAELEAELEARTLQYEYYRDSLFEALDCPRVPLDSFAKIKNGKTYKDFGAGNIPVYGSGGIMTYVDRFAYDKPTVLIPRKGSLGNLFYLEEPFWNVDTIFYTEIDEEQVIPKFLYYFLKTAHLEDLNTAGGVPSLTQKVLNKVLIPVPSLEEQQRIVDILDRFDALTSSLSEGLPAELAARRSQYEYYRDQLLSFPRKGENQ